MVSVYTTAAKSPAHSFPFLCVSVGHLCVISLTSQYDVPSLQLIISCSRYVVLTVHLNIICPLGYPHLHATSSSYAHYRCIYSETQLAHYYSMLFRPRPKLLEHHINLIPHHNPVVFGVAMTLYHYSRSE
jgi:hypothetical protein